MVDGSHFLCELVLDLTKVVGWSIEGDSLLVGSRLDDLYPVWVSEDACNC